MGKQGDGHAHYERIRQILGECVEYKDRELLLKLILEQFSCTKGRASVAARQAAQEIMHDLEKAAELIGVMNDEVGQGTAPELAELRTKGLSAMEAVTRSLEHSAPVESTNPNKSAS